jgi:hypothetical protein
MLPRFDETRKSEAANDQRAALAHARELCVNGAEERLLAVLRSGDVDSAYHGTDGWKVAKTCASRGSSGAQPWTCLLSSAVF